VVITGSPSERREVSAVLKAMRATAVDAGRTSLGALAVLIRDSVLIVTNDTGTSHLAAALRVPSVVVFVASDPRRWAPLDARRHMVVGADGLIPIAESCTTRCLGDGCSRFTGSAGRPPPPTAVVAAVRRQLSR
jgi:ADP-heptose:LPS heptosyltransferase